jgi:hypothetical protein
MERRAQRVNAIFIDCLFTEAELASLEPGVPPEGAIVVDSFLGSFGLHSGRVAAHKDEIRECLAGLPSQFYQGGGGGWSTLNLCMDENDIQWGEHVNVQELCVLAIAAGFGRWLMPRSMWSVFPAAMPYVVFDLAETH